MIKYTGKTDVKDKMISVINEMIEDKDLSYTIQVYENRENDKISKFMVEVINIENSMPNF